MLRVGRYELHAIEAGRFRLDGGSMFGVVPRVLWEKTAPPDDLNRIALSMRCLLAVDRSAGRVILVDSGPGAKWNADEITRFAFEVDGDPLGAGLRRCGVRETDITDVVVTHLHFDHNAGLTHWAGAPGGETEPRFPGAKHWIHAGQLAHATAPTLKDRASYFPRDYQVLVERDLFQVFSGEAPACPFEDVEWFMSHGHTPCQILPRFCGDGVAVQFVADLIPTVSHLPLPWVMAFDIEPLRTIEEKALLYELCAQRDVVLFFEHDPQVVGARIATGGRRPEISETVEI